MLFNIQSLVFVLAVSVSLTDCLEPMHEQSSILGPSVYRTRDGLPAYEMKDRNAVLHDIENVDQLRGEAKASLTKSYSERQWNADGMISQGRSRHRYRRSTDFSSDEIAALVDKHNDLRGQVSPEASNMEFMSWDDDLATMAQEWSETCYFAHGQPDNISPFTSLGQNLWLGSAGNTPPDGTGAVQAWYNEVQYYDYETTECSYVCGHYTQVVWASSYALGCGRSHCEFASSESSNYTNVYIITCNYGPAGNYVGAQPYDEGPSCTQCDSGVALCYNNLCNMCSLEEDGCECQVSCENCATVTTNCTCECQDGWYGADCSTECVDTHQYCWNSPGWPGPAYCDLHNAVPKGCPYMCGLCNLADPDFVCGGSTVQMTTAITEEDNKDYDINSDPTALMTSTFNVDDDPTVSTWTTETLATMTTYGDQTQYSTNTAESSTLSRTTPHSMTPTVGVDSQTTPDHALTTSSAHSTELPTSTSTTVLSTVAENPSTTGNVADGVKSTTSPGAQTSESTSVTADINSGCNGVTCQNGGTLEESSCTCLCAEDYQGEECQNVKTEAQYGVEITVRASIDIWQSIRDLLLRVVADIVTDWCNINFSTCCPNQGPKNSGEVLDYVNETDITVASGYPEESSASESSTSSFAVMLVVTPPLSTELCDSGSVSRRRRSIRLNCLHRQKRSSDIEVPYLDQEALYTAITENLDIIELELNMTIGDVTKGQVETAASTLLSIEVIVGIVVASVVVLIAIIVGGIICIHKSKHTTKVHAMSGSIKTWST